MTGLSIESCKHILASLIKNNISLPLCEAMLVNAIEKAEGLSAVSEVRRSCQSYKADHNILLQQANVIFNNGSN